MATIIFLLALTAIVWGARFWVAHLIDTREVITDGNGVEYLHRYFIRKPNNKGVGRIYLHHILRSDHDRALHDHPWNFRSFILTGGYKEWADSRQIPVREIHLWTPVYGRQSTRRFNPGARIKRPAGWRHRLELEPGKTAWTLVFTSAKVRNWGFWPGDKFCPWKRYDNILGICGDE